MMPRNLPGPNQQVALAALTTATAMINTAEAHLATARRAAEVKGEAWLVAMMQHAGAMASAQALLMFAGTLCPEAKPPT